MIITDPNLNEPAPGGMTNEPLLALGWEPNEPDPVGIEANIQHPVNQPAINGS